VPTKQEQTKQEAEGTSSLPYIVRKHVAATVHSAWSESGWDVQGGKYHCTLVITR